jgi:hypothetical protein
MRTWRFAMLAVLSPLACARSAPPAAKAPPPKPDAQNAEARSPAQARSQRVLDDSNEPAWARRMEARNKPPAAKSSLPIDTSPAPIPDGHRRVARDGWSFVIPGGWQDTVVKPPVIYGATGPGGTRAEDTPLGMNLVVEDFDGDSEAYARANLPAINRVATVMSSTAVTLTGGHVVIVETLWPNGISPYRTLQLLAAARGKGYALTCADTDSRFEQSRPVCVAVLKSFRWPQ